MQRSNGQTGVPTVTREQRINEAVTEFFEDLEASTCIHEMLSLYCEWMDTEGFDNTHKIPAVNRLFALYRLSAFVSQLERLTRI